MRTSDVTGCCGWENASTAGLQTLFQPASDRLHLVNLNGYGSKQNARPCVLQGDSAEFGTPPGSDHVIVSGIRAEIASSRSGGVTRLHGVASALGNQPQ